VAELAAKLADKQAELLEAHERLRLLEEELLWCVGEATLSESAFMSFFHEQEWPLAVSSHCSQLLVTLRRDPILLHAVPLVAVLRR